MDKTNNDEDQGRQRPCPYKEFIGCSERMQTNKLMEVTLENVQGNEESQRGQGDRKWPYFGSRSGKGCWRRWHWSWDLAGGKHLLPLFPS